jgi:acetyl-CoA C-acetyltransferase
MALHAIRAGEAHVLVSAGAESVSRYDRGKSDGMPDTKNPLFATGRLPDVYIAMGQTAENVASARNVSRRRQDEFAARSQQLAQAAIASGFFGTDITPVTPVFRPDGTVTAGNCCPLNDGAAALIIMSDVRAASLGIAPMARVLATGVSAVSPEIMGMGPVEATRQALANAGLTVADIGLFEINEAFAAQVLPCVDDLKIDQERVNVHGGAIALGHPFGQTGARMTTTLINGLRFRDERLGVVTMCAAGGQGMALVIEKL